MVGLVGPVMAGTCELNIQKASHINNSNPDQCAADRMMKSEMQKQSRQGE